MSLLGIPGGAGENPPTITPAGTDATPVTQQSGSSASEKPSIFCHDLDADKSGTITADEIMMDKKKSVKDVLGEILAFLPKDTGNDTDVSTALESIRSLAEGLSSVSIKCDSIDDLTSVSDEIEKIKQDVNNLTRYMKQAGKNDFSQVAENFENQLLSSSTAQEAVGVEHNEKINATNLDDQEKVKNEAVKAQMEQALDQAVAMAMENKGKVDKTQILIETIQGLEILNIDTSAKFKYASGTGNDSRTTDGVNRGVDALTVTLTYEYKGQVYNISKEIGVPEGFYLTDSEKELEFEKRRLELSRGENAQGVWE